MLDVTIPGRGDYHFEHLVLDVNGTLALDGVLLSGVLERLTAIRASLQLHLVTADTHGRLGSISQLLGITGTRLRPTESESEQKTAYVRTLGSRSVVAIGNGANDVGMLGEAELGIVVLGPEGTAVDALKSADIAASSITQALDLLLFPKRLVATLRR